MPPKGGRKEPPREVLVSKALSFVLRHAAEKEGVKIDSQGYANVGELLLWRKLKGMKVTLSEVLDAVSSSDKQRFGLLYKPQDSSQQPPSSEANVEGSILKDGEQGASTDSTMASATAQALAANDPDPYNYMIRARQGHSIKTIDTTSLLQQLTLSDNPSVPLPDTVVHGTYHAAWPKILESGGLRCMRRNQIHFASGPPLSSILPDGPDGKVTRPTLKGSGSNEGVISGMRGDAQIMIYIDLKRALKAGCPFWISENGVILSEGMAADGTPENIVSTDFFDIVVETKNGLGVLWENGSLVKETPGWMSTAKLPFGKSDLGNNGGTGGKGGKGGKSSAPPLKVEKATDIVDKP